MATFIQYFVFLPKYIFYAEKFIKHCTDAKFQIVYNVIRIVIPEDPPFNSNQIFQCARWIPLLLHEDQMQTRASASKEVLKIQQKHALFLRRN